MDLDRFEDGLDRMIEAHGRKVRAGIDAVACGTQDDWRRAHEAEEAYYKTRDAFLDEVTAEGVVADLERARERADSRDEKG